jgi:hypothetical protein
VVLEGERRERRVAGRDAYALPSDEQERGPEQVRELRGGERRAQRGAGGRALGSVGGGEVTDERGS